MKRRAAFVLFLVLVAAGPTTAPTANPTEDELKQFAEALCAPIDKGFDKAFASTKGSAPILFNDKVSVLSFDLEKTDSLLHPVAATIVLRIYFRVSERSATGDCIILITAKVAKVDSGWLAMSCISNVEDEQVTSTLIDGSDSDPSIIGKTTDMGAPLLQKIIDSIGADEAAAKAARAAFKQASADLVVAHRRADSAESAMNQATEKCLSSLHLTDQYKAAKSKMDQALIDKQNADNWPARLDADSTYNTTRLEIQHMESSALSADPTVTSARQELDAARKSVEGIEEKIRGDYPQDAPQGGQ